MAKKIFFFLVALLIPALFANAASTTVNSQQELLEALQDDEVNTIVLGKDIETTQKINITRNIYLDGAGHTIKYVGTFGDAGSTDNTKWNGIYVLQVYKSTATIKDIKLTGGNAGLLINGALVTFLGTVDVSGNGFGGIELGQGNGVTDIPKLSLKDGAKITNSTESNSRPTLWVPEDTKKGVLEINGISKDIQPHQELTLSEINEMFGITEENPNTGDNFIMYLALGIISTVSFIYYSIKTLKKDF